MTLPPVEGAGFQNGSRALFIASGRSFSFGAAMPFSNGPNPQTVENTGLSQQSRGELPQSLDFFLRPG